MNHTMLFDMHTHSQNSHDSICPVKDTALAAIKNNISAFAVTDHCDIEFYTESDIPTCIKNSIKETEEASILFKDKVKILKGIEIGEGIWNKKYTDEIINSCKYDVIIGSVHAARYKQYLNPYSIIDFSKMDIKEIENYLSLYFEDVLSTVKEVPCDIMAHLTCPLRYITGKYNIKIDMTKYKNKIFEILKYIINNSIAMEINTSSVSTTHRCFMPDEWIIKKFKDMGGYLVTLGSDSHIAQNVGKDFDKAILLLKNYGFENYYYYENRKSIPCKI